MTALLDTALLIALLAGAAASPLQADGTHVAKAPDTFFAGIVSQFSADSITVSRIVRGKGESRTFRMTPLTKVEGKLSGKVRVTVRYVSTEEGDTATLVVVRGYAASNKSKKD